MSPAENTNQHTNPSANEGLRPMDAAQVYPALQKVARQRGRSTEEILTLYGLERVLARLQRTSYAEDFVLKGGVLLAAYALRRPTRDADMQAVGFPLDEQHLRAVLEAGADPPSRGRLTTVPTLSARRQGTSPPARPVMVWSSTPPPSPSPPSATRTSTAACAPASPPACTPPASTSPSTSAPATPSTRHLSPWSCRGCSPHWASPVRT